MIRLLKATVHKYKCIEQEQSFAVEKDITVLVGMNESGKTSILESTIASIVIQLAVSSKVHISIILAAAHEFVTSFPL